VAGPKRHLVMDCLGLVLAVGVTAASVQDRDAAVPLLERLRRVYFSIRLVWADGGYAGRLVDWAAHKLQLTLDIVKRNDDTCGFVVLLPKGEDPTTGVHWLVVAGPAKGERQDHGDFSTRVVRENEQGDPSDGLPLRTTDSLLGPV
jgi:hypothetical protein